MPTMESAYRIGDFGRIFTITTASSEFEEPPSFAGFFFDLRVFSFIAGDEKMPLFFLFLTSEGFVPERGGVSLFNARRQGDRLGEDPSRGGVCSIDSQLVGRTWVREKWKVTTDPQQMIGSC